MVTLHSSVLNLTRNAGAGSFRVLIISSSSYWESNVCYQGKIHSPEANTLQVQANPGSEGVKSSPNP